MNTPHTLPTTGHTRLARGLAPLFALTCLACGETPQKKGHDSSPQWQNGRFENTRAIAPTGLWKGLKLGWAFIFDKPAGSAPTDAIPVQALTREALLQAPDGSLYRLGHSTLLLKLRGRFWLTDPVFAQRAFPVQWMGPARFHAPPITIDALPPIEGVLLSHDHYDHLDHDSILALADKTQHFIAPLGVGDRLIAWGVDPAKVRQLDWWDSVEINGLRFVATPARHFSGRGLSDTNSTLWASWVVIDGEQRLFFSGDGGYFDGFKTIGDRYGPFDVTFIECGAYDSRWAEVHMQPEEVVQAYKDLRGRWLVPIHNGTFDLGLHPWKEPFERLSALAQADGKTRLAWPGVGERLSLAQPGGTPGATDPGPWWRDLR